MQAVRYRVVHPCVELVAVELLAARSDVVTGDRAVVLGHRQQREKLSDLSGHRGKYIHLTASGHSQPARRDSSGRVNRPACWVKYEADARGCSAAFSGPHHEWTRARCSLATLVAANVVA